MVFTGVLDIVIRYLILVIIAKYFIDEFDFITAAICALIHTAVVGVTLVIVGSIFGSLEGFPLLLLTIISMGSWFMILMWKYELELNQAIVLSVACNVVIGVIVTLIQNI